MDSRALRNYAIWRLISSSLPYLNDEARSLYHEFTAVSTGQRKQRWQECTDLVSTSLPAATISLYVRNFFPNPSSYKREALQMLENMRTAFISMLSETLWMDKETKVAAIGKAKAMKFVVAYPQESLDNRELDNLYRNYSFGNSLLSNIRNVVTSATDLSYLNNNMKDWWEYAKSAKVNAYYLPMENVIYFPAAILQPPFFHPERPKYLNYGSIGWIMGHEIAHGYDDQGHLFDAQGKYANWWGEETKRIYEGKKNCIIQQYGKYGRNGMNLNGLSSQGENVADNVGIRIAYYAYLNMIKKHGIMEMKLPGISELLTPAQLFWLSAGSNYCGYQTKESLKSQIQTGVHSPGEWRVRGTLANSMEFMKDWGCNSNNKDNSKDGLCSIW